METTHSPIQPKGTPFSRPHNAATLPRKSYANVVGLLLSLYCTEPWLLEVTKFGPNDDAKIVRARSAPIYTTPRWVIRCHGVVDGR